MKAPGKEHIEATLNALHAFAPLLDKYEAAKAKGEGVEDARALAAAALRELKKYASDARTLVAVTTDRRTFYTGDLFEELEAGCAQ